MKRSILLLIVIICSLVMVTAASNWSTSNSVGILDDDGQVSSWEPIAGNAQNSISVLGVPGGFRVTHTVSGSPPKTYFYAGSTAPTVEPVRGPDAAQQNWAEISPTTNLHRGTGSSAGTINIGTGGNTNNNQPADSAAPDIRTEIIPQETGAPVIVTTTTQNGQTTFSYQIMGSTVMGDNIAIPEGTNVDWNRFDHTQSNRIPTSGGGYRQVYDRNTYTDKDANLRDLRIVENGVTQTITYQSDEVPPSPNQNPDFTQRLETRISLEGVNGELVVEQDSNGRNSLPINMQNRQFYQAAIDAGISRLEFEDVQGIPGGAAGTVRIQDGTTTIQLDPQGDVVAYSDDSVRIYSVNEEGDVTVGGLPLTANAQLRVSGDGVGAAIDPKTGAINREQLDALEYRQSLRLPGGEGPEDDQLVVNTHRIVDGRAQDTTSLYRPHSGELRVTRADGSEAVHHLSFGTAELARQNWNIDGVDNAALAAQIQRQFGPNAVVAHVKGKVFSVDGEFHEVNEQGGLEDCGTLFPCSGFSLSDDELEQFETDVLDPVLEDLDKPSTFLLQLSSVLNNFKWYSNRYVGFSAYSSIMFSEEFLADWRAQVDAVLCDMLNIGGTACWTSKICDLYVDVEQPQGALIGSTPDGSPRAIANIQAEKSDGIILKGAGRKQLVDIFGEKVIRVQGKLYDLTEDDVDLSDLPDISARSYKVTLAFSPTENSMLNVVFKGDQEAKWFAPDLAVQGGTPYSRIRSNPIIFLSPNDYTQVCLTFSPGQISQSGREVSQYCTPISQYSGAATAPINIPSINDSSTPQVQGNGDNNQPQEGGGV